MENNHKANQPLSSTSPASTTNTNKTSAPSTTPTAQSNSLESQHAKPVAATSPVADKQASTAKTLGASIPSAETVSETISSLRDTVEERYTQGKADVQSWINETDWNKTINQLPQSIKDLGSKAADQFNRLTTTQKVVGGALLLGGLGYLASRKTQKSTKDTWSDIKARSKDYRSGNIPRVEASARASEWNPSTSSRSQESKSSYQGPTGKVNLDS